MMKVRLTRMTLAIAILAAMALSTGAGIRWGFSTQIVAPPPAGESVSVSVDVTADV